MHQVLFIKFLVYILINKYEICMVERRHRIIREPGMTMVFHTNVPLFLCVKDTNAIISKKIMASRHVFDESVFPYKTSPTSTATQPSSHTLLIFDTWIPCSDFNSVAGNTVTAPVPPCLSPLPTFTIPTLALQASDATLSQESRHNLQPEALPLVPQVEGEQSVEEEAH